MLTDTKEDRRIAVSQKCTVLGYDVNNTKGRITGDSVRENGERSMVMGVGGVRARQDFADSLMTGRAII